jgi:hypothetical protein
MTGGSLSWRDLLSSYSPGLITGGVTRPPDLLQIILRPTPLVKTFLLEQREVSRRFVLGGWYYFHSQTAFLRR